MTLRQLISTLTHYAQEEDFDLDAEVLVALYDKNGDGIKDLPITDTDWFWSNALDLEDTKKIVGIQVQMTD